jgi:hypothetical protein
MSPIGELCREEKMNYSRGGLLAIGATILIAGGGALSAIQPKGEVLPLRLVDRYLAALEKKDEAALLAMNANDYQADLAIRKKLTRWGGWRVEKRQVFRTRTSEAAVRLKVYGTYQQDGKAQGFEDSINLVYRRAGLLPNSGDRWQLAMGDLKASAQR